MPSSSAGCQERISSGILTIPAIAENGEHGVKFVSRHDQRLAFPEIARVRVGREILDHIV